MSNLPDLTENILSVIECEVCRKYRTDGREYILKLEYLPQENCFEVQTWGFDYERIEIPKTRQDLIRLKTNIQLRKMDGPLDGPDQVALRFYLDILRTN